MMRSHSFARACAISAALTACLLGSSAAQADQQRDPELREVVERAITQAQCFTDRYDSAVWYKMMEPKLRKLVPSEAERMDMLRVIYCETHRPGETRLPAGLIMGLMSVESAFNRYAVSSAGAVGTHAGDALLARAPGDASLRAHSHRAQYSYGLRHSAFLFEVRAQ
jgi:soluble lytic murein transglycosylase-like protein